MFLGLGKSEPALPADPCLRNRERLSRPLPPGVPAHTARVRRRRAPTEGVLPNALWLVRQDGESSVEPEWMQGNDKRIFDAVIVNNGLNLGKNVFFP